jgi:hypothetical protein
MSAVCSCQGRLAKRERRATAPGLGRRAMARQSRNGSAHRRGGRGEPARLARRWSFRDEVPCSRCATRVCRLRAGGRREVGRGRSLYLPGATSTSSRSGTRLVPREHRLTGSSNRIPTSSLGVFGVVRLSSVASRRSPTITRATQPFLIEPDVEAHAVDPHVYEVAALQQPARELTVLVLPLHRQPGDHRSR